MIQIDSLASLENTQRLAQAHPELFWAEVARDFVWYKPWDRVVEQRLTGVGAPVIKWFDGARTNITANCLDRHVEALGDRIALIFEPAHPDSPAQFLTYVELYRRVCKVANVLRGLGVKQGDRVCIYMPMIPELMIAMLACARIGAIHSVVFGGFSAQSLADRIIDATAQLVITADAGNRAGKTLPILDVVLEAIAKTPEVRQLLVCEYQGLDTASVVCQAEVHSWKYLEALADEECPAEEVDSEHPLFILYTSGSTGKPKGVVHSTAGYMVYAEYSFRNVFDYREGDVFFCTADAGWITGHTYLTYAPLLAGATTVLFEGVPTWPQPDRFWQIVERHQVNILYTAPTAIRSLMAQGYQWLSGFDMPSLRVLGSVGEPINEEAWHWYHEHVGKGRCAITDTWWQTETGGIMIATLAGLQEAIPAHAGTPLPGVEVVLLSSDGKALSESEAEGILALASTTPGMIRTTWGDHERCFQTYFGSYPGYYFTGDGAQRKANGHYRILGRVDDVINVSGHRFGTAEIENAIDEHPAVVESAVVGYPHDIKGQGIYAFVIIDMQAVVEGLDLNREITAKVVQLIGPIARPDKIQLVTALPKTRSGKIMRRILRKIAEGETGQLGDTSTLLDPSVVEILVSGRV